MPSERPLQRLKDILDNVDRIFQYTKDLGFADFVQDRLVRDAVERCLLRIAEAAKKLEGVVEQLAPDQPWQDIRALGNVIRHDYDAIDAQVIWNIVEHDLRPLAKAVEVAIAGLQNDV